MITGIGNPLLFRCSRCRLRDGAWRPKSDRGWIGCVKLTGRKRRGRRAGPRADIWRREYRCMDCGHVGWSNHVELKQLDERRGP